jgi:LysR family nitrogen assimilation transcriptional regulator
MKDVPGDARVALNLNQIRALLTVAEEGNLSRAAAALSMTQPALSRLVRQVEQRLGAPLFHRNGRGMELTEAGRRFRTHGQGMLEHHDALRREIDEMKHELSGAAAVGMPPGVAQHLNLPAYKRFTELHPKIKARITEDRSPVVRDRLIEGKLDAGIFYGPLHGQGELNAEILALEELYLIGPPGDPRLEGDEIALSALAELPLILPGLRTGFREIVEAALTRAGLEPRIHLEAETSDAQLALVREGEGYTVLPYSFIASETDSTAFSHAKIAGPALRRPVLLAVTPARPPSPLLRETARILREVFHDNLARGRWIKPKR